MAILAGSFFTGSFARPGELIGSLNGNLGGNPGGNPPPTDPVAGTVVEFNAYLATDMTNLHLWRLPEGFISQLSYDTIVVNFRGGDSVRLFGEFDYSFPVDVPVGGSIARYQETSGGAITFELRNFEAPIIEVLQNAGYSNQTVGDLLFGANERFTGSNFNDALIGFAGDDTMDGGAGDDALTGDEGADVIHGGDGGDLVLGGADDDKLYGDRGNDEVRGGEGNDEIQGGDGLNLLMGNVGNDTLTGGADADTLYGGQGWDVLVGGAGNDWLFGDKGFDALYGGAGADTFYFAPGSGIDRIHDFNAAEGDRVQLQLGTIFTVEQFGSDVLIISGQVDQVYLVGVQLSSLPSGWIF